MIDGHLRQKSYQVMIVEDPAKFMPASVSDV